MTFKVIGRTDIQIIIDWLFRCSSYLFLGAKKEKFRLTNADDIADDDEISLFLRAQMLSSMDCMWRAMV